MSLLRPQEMLDSVIKVDPSLLGHGMAPLWGKPTSMVLADFPIGDPSLYIPEQSS